MGTSTCDIMVVPKSDLSNKCAQGICGQVDGSVVPGMIGLEAGQSVFGDIYAWFQTLLLYPLQHCLSSVDETEKERLVAEISKKIFAALEREAAKLPLDERSELAIDWFNGRQTPNADQRLNGSLHNLTLGSDAPRVDRALMEATCFGSRRINDCLQNKASR